MQICTGCRRHVRPADPRCPFCDEPLRSAPAVASLGVAVLLGSAACGNGVGPTTAGATSTTGSSSGSLGASETGDPSTPTTGTTTTTTAATSTGQPHTTTAGELSSAGDEFVEDSGGSFYGLSGDVAPTHIECDNWAQDCPPGQKCSAYAFGDGTSWDSLKCVPVMPNPKQPGEPCTVEGDGASGIDDCDLGGLCWDVDDRNVGTCIALCKGTVEAPTCTDPETFCAIYNDGVLNLCLPSCDPLAQDCPTPDDVCIGNPSGDGFLCVLDASKREGQQHDPCEYANSCDPGLLCINATAAVECDPNASGCCQPYCDLTGPDPDAPCTGMGQICNPTTRRARRRWARSTSASAPSRPDRPRSAAMSLTEHRRRLPIVDLPAPDDRRTKLAVAGAPPTPRYAVWELTLKCDQKCVHCGSRAGHARPGELTTAEALRLVDDLRALGVGEITLIGGEAYLRDDFIPLIRAIRLAGMRCTMTTGGYNLTAARCEAIAAAGVNSVSVSIDGTAAAHDHLRAVPDSFIKALSLIHI